MSPRRTARSSAAALAAALAAVLLLVLPTGAGAQGERILSFVSEVTVNPDATLDVRETIRVVAANAEIRHGIYRDFPTRYRSALGSQYEVPFEVADVERDGRPEPWHRASEANGVRVYVGDKDRMVEPGEHTYVIAYRTGRQLGFFADHDELYWNATGNGWSFPIDEAEARVRLPRGATGVRLEGYTGPQGAKGRDFTASWGDDAGAIFHTTARLAPREGLTIVVMWPKGLVEQPGGASRTAWFFQDNRGVFAGVLGLLGVLAYYVTTWVRVGRDPERGAIVPMWEPPQGLSPAAVRYLKRMSFDHKAFTAAVVNMGVKGHLVITEADKEYTLDQRKREGAAPLAPEESAAAGKLFGAGARIDLKQENHARIAGAIAALKAQLAGALEKVYFVLNRRELVIGLLLSAGVIGLTLVLTPGSQAGVGGFLAFWLAGWSVGCAVLAVQVGRAWREFARGAGSRFVSLPRAVFLTLFSLPFFAGEVFAAGLLFWQGSVLFALVLIGLAGLNVLFHYLLKAPTSAGRRLLDRIEGFELYIAAAESDRFKRLGSPERTPALYERFLPYAIALDLESRWSEAFTDVLAAAAAEPGGAYSPAWYHGDFGHGWSPSAFAGAVGEIGRAHV
jgi:hypothetical protein